VFRRYSLVAIAAIVLAGATLCLRPAESSAQTRTTPTPSPTATPKPTPTPKVEQASVAKKGEQVLTGDSVAETVILVHGVRERLVQIRKSGVERGKIMRATEDGRTEEITYERSFKRGENSEKDKIRLDQKMPSIEFSLVYNEGKVFGVVKGTSFTPRQQDVTSFLSDSVRGIETLLRYKENGATLQFIGKEKQKGIDMWVLDVTDKDKRRTRFYLSAYSGRLLWLEYEEPVTGSPVPVKFKRTFHDYRVVQGTRVPYRSVLYADGRQVEESQILTVVYGVKMDDSVFQNPSPAD
jgi:hypothetical protein